MFAGKQTAKTTAMILACAALCASAAGASETREVIGYSYIITNDSIGEFRDRWQSSVVEGSVFFGPSGADPHSVRPGEILELSLGSQIMTPDDLSNPAPDDRPFAGVLSLGVATHGMIGASELSLGAELAAVGPQTKTFQFQRWLHERLNFALPETEGNEIEDGYHVGASAELGRSFGEGVRVRPFIEARAGIETLARAGIDLTWGALGRDDLMVREAVTGQRVPGLMGSDVSGWSFIAGADAAWVGESLYLPEDEGLEPEPRGRLRAGAHWQTNQFSAFYGLTYLTPEFEGQEEGQFVGAVQLRLNF